MTNIEFGTVITADGTYGFPAMKEGRQVIVTISGTGADHATLHMILEGTTTAAYLDANGNALTQTAGGNGHAVFLPQSGRLALVVASLGEGETVKLNACHALVNDD
jgi:hypothetical protein